jgi:hypothetical protein
MRKFFVVAGTILAVVAVGRMIYGFLFSVDEVNRFDASVGDCVAAEMSQEVTVVACDGPQAWRRVGGKEIRPSPATEEMVNQACDGYPAAQDVFWRTLLSGQVLILCLEPVRP